MKKYNSVFADFIISILITFIVLSISIDFTLVFKPLYYFDISNLSIESSSNISRSDILKNYNYTINYLLEAKTSEYNLPTLPSSPGAQLHFYEVKQLFIKMTIVLAISMAIVIFYGFFIKIKPRILKWSSIFLVLTSIGIIIPSLINFNSFFDFFHSIFFNNGYWQFDPVEDPIITILPEDFFLHCAILIISLWLLSSLILAIIYRKKKNLKLS
ncbi:MAG: TIGR01906 family membrane protein [Clostridiaceae bacterium]|nr:TIGR01906 family membrane protein [Clostridiaceae bacterium]